MVNAPAARSALEVLSLLARHTSPLPAATIARELDLPRSTAYHLLTVLTETGFVTHVPEDRRYGLGPAAYELGSAYQRQAPLQRIGRPALARLAEATTHNGHLAVLHGRDVLYVAEERAPGRPLLVTDVGVRLPATLTATGLAMLAALPGPQISALFPHARDLVQRDGRGPRTVTALRRELVAIRARGYALEIDLVTPGQSSVAVAVRDHQGYPVAAVAITYPSGDDPGPLAAAVTGVAQSLTRRIGGRPG